VTKRIISVLKHDMTAPRMTRVAVRVPHTTLDQINDWVDALGVRRSHFLGIALVAGVRSLMRASALELSWPAAAEELAAQKLAAEKLTADGLDDSDTDGGEPDAQAGEWAALRAQVASLEAEVARLQAEVARREAQAQPA
jgi:hypothetical protein